MAVPGVFVAPGGLGVSVVTGAGLAMVAAVATSDTSACGLVCHSCLAYCCCSGFMDASGVSCATLALGATFVSDAILALGATLATSVTGSW